MNLEEQYEKDTKKEYFCLIYEQEPGVMDTYYPENYVLWLEDKIKELQKENLEYLSALKVIEKESDKCKDKLKGMRDEK